MSDLLSLRPSQHRRVMDLLEEAGVDVSDWANYADNGRGPAANPRYCYEWAFVAPGRVVVLNIWHSDIVESDGAMVLRDNLRAAAAHHAKGLTAGSASWRKRAMAFDDAVQMAATDRLPIRLIICDGRKRQIGDHEASRVRARGLDPMPWIVSTYDAATGSFTLMRGVLPDPVVDQFSVGTPHEGPTETRSISGTVFVRDPAVRRAALLRAAGKCESCGQQGFQTATGATFLETHHIVPLSEGGPDTIANVAALCPNHHREAHFGAKRVEIRARLLDIARGN